MAIYGALGEGFTQSYGTRPGEYLSRGLATMAGTTKTVTVNLPIRTVTHVVLTVKSTTDPTVTVSAGSYSGNTFVISAWGGAPGTGVTGAAASVTVGASPATLAAAPSDGYYAVALNGATLSSMSLTRGAYGPVNLNLPTSTLATLYPVAGGDVFILTYTVATPTVEFLPFAASTSYGAATSSTATVEWAAWGTL